MAHEVKSRTMELLDHVDMLLQEVQEPMHYKQLCDVLIQSGLWANPWGKQPDQILYSAIHNDIKRWGQGQGRFLFLGGGVFCTILVEGLEQLIEELPEPKDNDADRDPYKRAGDMPGEAEQRRARAEAAERNRRCGNCTHLQWDGPNLHTHEVGSCSLYEHTRRACVFKKSEACEKWKLRTPAQVNSDRETPANLRLSAQLVLAKRPGQ